MVQLDPRTRILVVDDGDAIRVLMRKYLETMGYRDIRLADRPETTIVVMTAHPGTHPDVTALVAQGARDHLPKPIQSSRLRETLDRIAVDLEGSGDGEDDKVSVDTSYG